MGRGRGRPSTDYRKPISSTPKSRSKRAKFKECRIIASVANIKLRVGRSCVSDINSLTQILADACKTRRVVVLFRKSVFKLLGGQLSPLLLAKSYPELKKSWFVLLSYAYANQKNFRNKFESYEELTTELFKVLPALDHIIIISYLLEPYAYCDSLIDAIYLASGSHFSKRQVAIWLDEINLKNTDSIDRFSVTLIMAASQNKLPPWWWGIYRACKSNFDENKEDPKSKAINFLMNKAYRFQEQNSSLRIEVNALKEINSKFADTNDSLSKKCDDLEIENERLTKADEAKQNEVVDLRKYLQVKKNYIHMY